MYDIFEAWLLRARSLLSRQVNMAGVGECIFHLFGSHHSRLVSPGYLKGWRILTMTAVILGPKILSRTHVQVNAVVTSIASRSDPLTEICFSPN